MKIKIKTPSLVNSIATVLLVPTVAHHLVKSTVDAGKNFASDVANEVNHRKAVVKTLETTPKK